MVVAFDAAGVQVLRALPRDVPAVAATEAGGLPGTGRTTLCLDERAAASDARNGDTGAGIHRMPCRLVVRDS